MNRTNQPPRSTAANRLKALLALLAIFAITAVITFGGRRALGRSLDAQPTQADLLQARADAVTAIPQLPKDTEDKLAAALYPQLAPITPAFSDPLVDRAGIDQTSQPSAARLAPALMTAALPLTPPVPEKLSRLTQWQQSVRAANAGGLVPPSITTAYLISEVSPTGRVNMKGSQGAWLYIDAEKRQIPANIGAKFYDGVLVSIDPDVSTGGVVFRTSTGQTKMLHWDRQEDFTNTTPAVPPTAGRGEQAKPQLQPQQYKPVSQNSSLTQPELQSLTSSNTPIPAIAASTSTQSRATRVDYSDLQVAVRDRHRAASTTAPIQPSSQTSNTVQSTKAVQATEAAASPAQSDNLVITPTSKAEPTKPTTSVPALPETNFFSTGTLRRNKLNYAHVVYGNYPARAIKNAVSLRALHNNTFNLDDPRSFNPEPVALTSPTPTETSVADAEQTGNDPGALSEDSSQTDAQILETQTQQKDQLATPTSQPSPAKAVPTPTPAPGSQHNTLCDPAYRGESITITNESNRPLSLLNLVNRLNEAYGANIVLDYDVQETPVRLTINNAPWTSILRTLLDLNDLDMVCLDGGIVQIAKRSKIASMGDLRRRSAPIVREVFRLRYLQQTAGGRANLAGQTQAGNGATIQSLEDAIRDILKAGGDPRGEARRVPGRNQLLVAATHEQMEDIRDLISRVDRPGYQVKISALVYTANENRLRDIGSQLSIVVGNTQGTNLGGGTTLPSTGTTTSGTGGTGTGTGSASGQPSSGINPGGIPGLATGMRAPTNGLGAANPLATFGVTSLFGTAQFAYQLTLAQQKGIVNIQSRPFGIVSDGDTFDLVAGTQIPVVTTTIAGGAPFQSGQVQFIEASRIARITPQVAEDEQGNPNYVTLNIQLENNSVDTSLGTFNGVPGVNRQSLQTVLRLRNGETVVIGGLAADQVANSMSKVPGLGDLPLFGNLFKKRTNQENRDRLYFAITVEVIPQDSPMPNFQAPADAITTPPPPPRAQRPTPYRKPQ
jgi:type II secretory pathway component GspD/PulD (secretin)